MSLALEYKGFKLSTLLRQGIPIKPHKGGRTIRYNVAMTPAVWDAIHKQLKPGQTFNDWLEEKAKQENKTR